MRTNQAVSFVAIVSSFLAGCSLLSVNGKSAGSAPASATSSGGAAEGGSSAADSDAHAKLGILDIKIGMPIEQPGFVCVKRTDPSTYNGAECVKFIDARCKDKDLHIAPKPYGKDAPRGCFIESETLATSMDGFLLQQRMEVSWGKEKVDPARFPLINLHTYGTKSNPSKIARIVYTLAVDDLVKSSDEASDSKLYKGLVARYGQPKSIHSGKVSWSAGTTELVAYCDLGICTLEAEDSTFKRSEDERSEEQEAKTRQGNAPAPQL